MRKELHLFLWACLFLVVSTVGAQTTLTLTGGTNRDVPSGDNPTSGIVQFKDDGFRSSIGGTDWAETWTSGTHTFVVALENDNNENCTLTLAAFDEEITNWYADNSWVSAHQVAIASISVPDTKTLTLEVSQDYAAVYLYASGYKKVNIQSITRTVGGVAPSVNAPTIAPATGTTYAGNLSVTITPGEGNDHVKYSISGSNEDVTDQTITTATVFNLTGTGTITVTATGYDDALETNASSTTECEYTYYVPNGKTDIAYGIPHVVNTAMYTYTFENGDNVSTTGFSSSGNPSPDDSYQGNGNLWLKNDSQGNAWSSQVYINLNSSDWPAGTKAILHFAMKSSTDFDAHGESMEIAFQQNSEGNYTTCGIFSTGMVPTSEWVEYDLETTVTDAARCEKLYFNCGKFTGQFRFDDIILYKVEEAATGGDNHFTTDDQVANIASSAFSGLNAGDYICADVTGTPETIKLVCNDTDYDLTQFNDGTLWGIKATADMVTALQANNSQFKGHDLTLNNMAFYQTKTIDEGSNDLTMCNNVFVELTRSFEAETWNTICLPFVPTAEQATALFGYGYKLAEFTSVSEYTMEFTTTDTFAAGVPYLVKPTESKTTESPTVFDNVSITATTASNVEQTDGGDTYTFAGTFVPKTFASSECAISRFVASENKLNTPAAGTTMKALRAYFVLPDAYASVRNFTIDGFEDESTTSINEEHLAKGESSSVIYNLAGQRVAQPTKGLYIVNGKKVVLNK